jgi:hypothetical protein
MNLMLMVAIWSGLCALATGGLVWFVMHSRMEVRLSRQREKLAEARATLAAQKENIQNTMVGVEETTRRKALDDFLADLRIEERHYVREHKVLFVTKKMLVRQERIFFRNIPLSNWVEQEIAITEGADLDALAKTLSVFSPELLLNSGPPPFEESSPKLLR